LPVLVAVLHLVRQVGLHQVVLQLAAAVTLLNRQALELHGQLQYRWWYQRHLWMVLHLLLLVLLTHRFAQCL
jgi:hypothetical protein